MDAIISQILQGNNIQFNDEMKVDISFEILSSLFEQDLGLGIKAAAELIPSSYNELASTFSKERAFEVLTRKVLKHILNPLVHKRVVGFYSLGVFASVDNFDDTTYVYFLGLACLGMENSDRDVKLAANYSYSVLADLLNPNVKEVRDMYFNSGLQILRNADESKKFKILTLSAIGIAIESFYLNTRVRIPIGLIDEIFNHFFEISSDVDSVGMNLLIKIIPTVLSGVPQGFVFPEKLLEFLENNLKHENDSVSIICMLSFDAAADMVEFERLSPRIPNVLSNFKEKCKSSTSTMKAKEIAFRVLESLFRQYKEKMESYLLEILECAGAAFEISRDNAEAAEGENEEEAPENLVLGERTSSENIRLQAVIQAQEEAEENKANEKEKKTEVQRLFLNAMRVIFRNISAACIESNSESIDRFVSDVEKAIADDESLHSEFALLGARLLSIKCKNQENLSEEIYEKASKIIAGLLKILPNIDDATNSLTVCDILNELISLKQFDVRKVGGLDLLSSVEDAYVHMIMECRKINDEDRSKSAYIKRELLYDMKQLLASFSKIFGPEFAPVLKRIYEKSLPYFPARYEDHRSIFNSLVCLIAETCDYIKLAVIPLGPIFIPLFARFLDDQNTGVRHNASYGLGTIFSSGKGAFREYYDSVLPSLYKIASSLPEETALLGARDNALSALAKMIAADPSGLPVSDIALRVLGGLPLIKDLAENEFIYDALITALEANSSFIEQNKDILSTKFSAALNDNGVPQPNKQKVDEFMKAHNLG
jgi:hypothetical protein